jgi:hypothetical protein
MEGQRYSCLAVGRIVRDLVTHPDGTKSMYPQGEGRSEARRLYVEEPWKRLLEEHSAVRQRFVNGTTVEKALVKPPGAGLLTAPITVERIVYPDGETEDCEIGNSEERIETCADRKHPKPEAPSIPENVVVTDHSWRADLYSREGSRELDLDLGDWDYGLPIASILAHLEDLAEDGWRILHVSEDRGLFRGDVVASDAAITRIRYLLARAG